ncbi:hypothetical protein [Frankia sp. CiP3]|uniref:hypothetical protein n=1 Tax=Frankia sp. CiP3 TaxID=2880971 RepID=UPI001EF4B194|nr:hypothetical protein [Frankia sp. CiP3]
MDMSDVLAAMGRPGVVATLSEPSEQAAIAETAAKLATTKPLYLYRQDPSLVRVRPWVRTSPMNVLRELGVATTFYPDGPFSDMARHWAQVRYCGALTTRTRGVSTLPQLAIGDTSRVVHHHKTAQSEHLGIGFAMVVARAVLNSRHPGFRFQAMDAEVALADGSALGHSVRSAGSSLGRPDYILLGTQLRAGRFHTKIYLLECKGTHGEMSRIRAQLAKASVQLSTLRIDGRTPPGLMVATKLDTAGISCYVFDPPGDENLLSGAAGEFDDIVTEDPEPFPFPRRHPTYLDADIHRSGEQPSDEEIARRRAEAGWRSEELLRPIRGAADILEVPAERRRWLLQMLARSSAFTSLLYAGDRAGADTYFPAWLRPEPPTSGQLPLDDAVSPPQDFTSIRSSFRLGPDLEFFGISHRMPLPDGRVLVVRRGVEQQLYGLLSEHRLARSFRRARDVVGRWRTRSGRQNLPADVGADGTGILMEVLDR